VFSDDEYLKLVGLLAAIITELTRRIEGEKAREPGSEEEERWRRFVVLFIIHLHPLSRILFLMHICVAFFLVMELE